MLYHLAVVVEEGVDVRRAKLLTNQGFSLVEVILVVFLLAVFMGMALNSVKTFASLKNRIQLDCAAKMVASDIRLLQQASMNAGPEHKYALRFFRVEPHHYDLVDRVRLIKQVMLKDCGYKNIVFTGVPAEVSFSLQGAPAAGYTIILQCMKTSPVIVKEITVLPATGRVMVK